MAWVLYMLGPSTCAKPTNHPPETIYHDVGTIVSTSTKNMLFIAPFEVRKSMPVEHEQRAMLMSLK